MRGDVRRRPLARAATVVSVVGLAIATPVLAGGTAAHAAPAPVPLPVHEAHPQTSPARRAQMHSTLGKSTLATTIPFWSEQFDDGNSLNQYPNTLVGADPLDPASNKTTTIPVKVIPLVFQYGGVTYDPTVANGCGTDIASQKTMGSPIFKNHDYVQGGTDLGKGQYIDEFRRAEYWSVTGGGASPKYHTKLSGKLLKKITVTVPAGSATEYHQAATPSCHLLELSYYWLDNFLQTTIPTLNSAGVTPLTFPMFLTSNVVSYDNSGCCILGYHWWMFNSAFNGAVQTYGISNYESSTYFGPDVADVSTLSHEVGEWIDDPYGDNGTDLWGHIGQVQNCQNNLEVGDPLSGTIFPVTIGKNTYHVQDLAFDGWFYHWNSNNMGVNNWFSFNGTFQSSAAPCP